MQNNDREKRAREKLFAKYTQFNLFSSISNLVNIVANNILFNKNARKSNSTRTTKKNVFANLI